MEYQSVINNIVEECKQVLGKALVGVYLHGSLAMGCFHPEKSDIDLLVVIDNEITDTQKKLIMETIVTENSNAPKKGIELSIVREEYCINFRYPTPFDLHFSIMHLNWYKNDKDDYIQKMKGIDPDLAAHFTIIKNRGIVLYGKEVDEVFNEIPAEAYLDSIKNDVAEAEVDVLNNPMYIILNLCRVLAYVKDGLILSKKEGGEWGLKNVNIKYIDMIQTALEHYNSEKEMEIEEDKARQYCRYMKDRIGF